jgi:uncharacterized protein YkwD
MKIPNSFILPLALAFAACAGKTPAPNPVTSAPPPQNAAAAASDQGPQVATEEIARQLLEALNQERTAHGLQPLTTSPELTQTAQQHTDTMVSGTFLSTRGPGEPDPVTRITSQGVKTRKLGEDVGRLKTRPDRVADETLSIWMSAAPNRKNILSPIFTKTGIGVTHAPDGDYYVSADFAQ